MTHSDIVMEIVTDFIECDFCISCGYSDSFQCDVCTDKILRDISATDLLDYAENSM
jgi:hypothetical protein